MKENREYEKKQNQILCEERCICLIETQLREKCCKKCYCDYHQEQNKNLEKKDWEELDYEDELVDYGMGRGLARKFVSMQKANLNSFFREKLKEEREKWRLKNAGLYRQIFGEMNDEKTFTAKELWKMFNDYSPLFTEDQKKELKDNLNSIMKGDGNK